MSQVSEFHAHVYFGEETVERARSVCERARDAFDIEMGRMHLKPVGPHPRWSCQLRVPPEKFGEVILWLSLNRDGLTVFVHPETGDHLRDHTEHSIWMGEMLELDVSVF